MRPLVLVALGLAACGPRTAPRISDPLPRLFAELDDDGDGTLSRDELGTADPDDLLPRLDQDSDGRVSPAELRSDLDACPEDLSAKARHGARTGPQGAPR